MRHPKIVVFETDGALAEYLEPAVNHRAKERPRERRWLLRESRQAPACLQLLRSGGPAVLVVKIGRHLVRELTFLEEAHATLPDVPIVAVGDAEDATLVSLALELGASYVLFPPQPRQQLAEIVGRLMAASIQRSGPEPEPEPTPLLPSAELPHEPES